MLRVTFYSYKGGVGRTLALLNVATLLARAGRKVVVVDLDLEAPGFGLSLDGRSTDLLGVSDFCFDIWEQTPRPISAYMRPRDDEDRLWEIPCGTQALELSQAVATVMEDPASPEAGVFATLLDRVQEEIEPDYIFFDSRTGRAEISAVSTLELPDLMVALTSLGEQSVGGLELLLEQVRNHMGRAAPIPTIGVLSPVPRAQDLDPNLPSLDEVLREVTATLDPEEAQLLHEERLERHPLYRRTQEVLGRLRPGLQLDLEATRGRCGHLDPSDLVHALEYDPSVPLGDELQISRVARLVEQYRRLALSIERAAGHKESLFEKDAVAPPLPISWPPA